MNRRLVCRAVFAGAVLLFCFWGSWAQAVQGSDAAVEALGRKHDLSKSETGDLARALRGAVNVGLGQGRLESLVDAALSAGMESRYLVRALSLCTNTALNGLPAASLLNKLGEGLAKKAEGRDIVEAMETRALSLKKARQILSVLIYDEKPKVELELLLATVASSLERGVDENAIEELFRKEGLDPKKIILNIERLP